MLVIDQSVYHLIRMRFFHCKQYAQQKNLLRKRSPSRHTTGYADIQAPNFEDISRKMETFIALLFNGPSWLLV